MRSLRYHDDEVVEMFDRVEADGVSDAAVVALHPRSGEVTIRYEDHHAAYRTTCNPVIRRERRPVSQINLVRRDGS
jgi:hypothetical protein